MNEGKWQWDFDVPSFMWRDRLDIGKDTVEVIKIYEYPNDNQHVLFVQRQLDTNKLFIDGTLSLNDSMCTPQLRWLLAGAGYDNIKDVYFEEQFAVEDEALNFELLKVDLVELFCDKEKYNGVKMKLEEAFDSLREITGIFDFCFLDFCNLKKEEFNHLCYFRSKLGLTQKEMAERFGFNLRTYERWESKGVKPPNHVVHMVSKIVELEEKMENNNDLVGETEEEKMGKQKRMTEGELYKFGFDTLKDRLFDAFIEDYEDSDELVKIECLFNEDFEEVYIVMYIGEKQVAVLETISFEEVETESCFKKCVMACFMLNIAADQLYGESNNPYREEELVIDMGLTEKIRDGVRKLLEMQNWEK